jgi:hypothetical protein
VRAQLVLGRGVGGDLARVFGRAGGVGFRGLVVEKGGAVGTAGVGVGGAGLLRGAVPVPVYSSVLVCTAPPDGRSQP